jgi:hypothetical protein
MRTDPKTDRRLLTAVTLASAVLAAACASPRPREADGGARAAPPRRAARTEVLTVDQIQT